MLKIQRNSRKQGDVGLGIAIGYFATQGDTIAIPLTDSQEYDLIVDLQGQLKRIQVKTTYCQNQYDIYQVDLRTKGGNRSGQSKVKKIDSSKADLLFVLTENNTTYLIPISSIENMAILSLGNKYQKYKLTGNAPCSGL